MFGDRTGAWIETIKQAKALEREQIETAFNEGDMSVMGSEYLHGKDYFERNYNND
jgi:hypothetical protein